MPSAVSAFVTRNFGQHVAAGRRGRDCPDRVPEHGAEVPVLSRKSCWRLPGGRSPRSTSSGAAAKIACSIALPLGLPDYPVYTRRIRSQQRWQPAFAGLRLRRTEGQKPRCARSCGIRFPMRELAPTPIPPTGMKSTRPTWTARAKRNEWVARYDVPRHACPNGTRRA